MLTCKVCGRKFKSKDALGGHMSHAHPQRPPEVPPDEPESGSPEPAAAEPEDESGADEIRGYIAQGYSFEQMVNEMHLPERSVRREIARSLPPASQSERDTNLPATHKQTEVLNPELMLRRYTDGSYEDQLELRGMMKLRASILLANELANIQKVVAEADAKRLEPVLKMLQYGREEMDAAAARARESSVEIARTAAYEAAQGIGGTLSSELQAIKAGLPGQQTNPMQRMLTMLQTFPQMMIAAQNLMGMFGMKMPTGQPQPGQVQGQAPQFKMAGQPRPMTGEDMRRFFGDDE